MCEAFGYNVFKDNDLWAKKNDRSSCFIWLVSHPTPQLPILTKQDSLQGVSVLLFIYMYFL